MHADFHASALPHADFCARIRTPPDVGPPEYACCCRCAALHCARCVDAQFPCSADYARLLVHPPLAMA